MAKHSFEAPCHFNARQGHSGRHRDKKKYRNRQTDKQTNKQIDRETVRLIDRLTDRHIWQQKNRYKDKRRERQIWGGPKKVNLVLDQLERCGFLYGVQDVSNITSIVILDIAKF